MRRQPSAMYGVMCIYNIESSSISGAASCTVDGIAAEGARIVAVVRGGVRTRAFDIEDDAD